VITIRAERETDRFDDGSSTQFSGKHGSSHRSCYWQCRAARPDKLFDERAIRERSGPAALALSNTESGRRVTGKPGSVLELVRACPAGLVNS
jgi:hypothetical protein